MAIMVMQLVPVAGVAATVEAHEFLVVEPHQRKTAFAQIVVGAQ